MKKIFMLAMSIVLGASAAMAQGTPTVHKYSFEDQAIINGMSDNGKYVVLNGKSAESALMNCGARLINVDTEEITDLAANQGDNFVSMGCTDVTNDGTIVVGELNHKPAYWSKSTGKWTMLPCEDEEYFGEVRSVTTDGKYAVGRQSIDEDGFSALPALWDLTTNQLLETPGIPTKDMSGQDQDQNWFNQISADGKYAIGCISYSYIGSGFYYIYDIANKTYSPIGFTNDNKWTPMVDGIHFINSAVFSNNAQWVSGRAYMVKPLEGSSFPSEYETSYLYNTTTGEFIVYDNTTDTDIVASCVDNNGYAYAATPSGNPIREWSVRNGKYWFDIKLILQQRYGYDFKAKTGYDNTGTPLFVSDDCRRVAVMVDPYTSYVLDIADSFGEASNGIDLLGSYTTSPKAGSTISRLKEITFAFDFDIQVVGAANSAQIRDAQGNTVYNSVGISADGKKALVRFRTGTLEADKQFTLHIPAGTIALSSDNNLTNRDINITYNGRADKPVEAITIYPAEGSTFARIDNSTNPLLITYDVPVILPDSAVAYLYNENEVEPIAKLLMAYTEDLVAVFPATAQYLYKGNNYRVEIAAGSVTDVAGNGASEKLVINYKGSYEREVVYDDNSLLIENFNTAGVANFMPWDADRLKPNATAQAIGFDRNDYGWAIVWDEGDTNIAASSHSMYEPAGKSSDWLVTPQLYIPDDKCTLKFLSQSFLNGYQDYLKVYVWNSDEEIFALDDEIVARIQSEGTLVYNEVQSPGADENVLAGDWKENTVVLADFEGKNVYIAFLNDNNNQSAVFIDDVQVMHNKPVRVAFTNATSVIAQENIMIEGVLSIDSETETYQSLSLTLKDSEGTEIETLSATGLDLKKGDTYPFAFTKALPLTKGIENEFTITLLCNDTRYEIEGKISNLAFEPVKHIVLEEFSGRMCVNCPLGIVGIEHLEELYGELIIPICLRTYGDDPLGTGLQDYTTFLGVVGAPSAVINRSSISYPMVSIDGKYYLSTAGLEGQEPLWADVVAQELETPTEAEISINNLSVDESSNEFVIPCTVRYAMNAEDLNLNLFVVVLEDNVKTWQMNGFASITDPTLGEWASGGIYGKGVVYDYLIRDVCRSYDGLTFNGTGGYLPQTMIAGEDYTAELRTEVPANIENISNAKVVVMLIDANTGKVVNAARASEIAAVENVDNNNQVSITAQNGMIVVNTIDNAQVAVYSMNGTLINSASGNGNISLDAPAGIAIVKVVTDNAVVVEKVLVK